MSNLNFKNNKTVKKTILSTVNKILPTSKKSTKLQSNLILGLVVLSTVLTLISSTLPGELIKDITKLFDYGIYESKIDGIKNNMGCATIVGKAELNGLACMQNLFNKCSDIKMYSLVSSFLLFVIILLLAFNKKESKTKYKISFVCMICCMVLYMLINYMSYVMKNNSINDENCGLKDIEEGATIKYGISYYMNMIIMGLCVFINIIMFNKYKKILV